MTILRKSKLAPLAPAAVLAFSLSACTPQQALGTVAKVPTFETQSIRLDSVTLSATPQASLHVQMNVTNPNTFPVRLENFKTDLYINGQYTAEVNLPNINLPANGSAQQRAEVRLPLSLTSGAELLKVARGQQVAYRIDGTFTADLGALGDPTFGPLTLAQGVWKQMPVLPF